MSRAAEQAMASDIVEAFVDVGMADLGTYTAPGGGASIACRVIVSRARSPVGDIGSAVRNRDTITLLTTEVPSPRRDAVVVVDSSTYKLVQIVSEDAAVSTWEVA